MPSLRTFKHTPLSDAQSQIRLLEILPATDAQNDIIVCRLTTWSLHDAPEYHAISYVWGPARPTKTIVVDHELMSVRENCWYALWQVRLHQQCQYHWIDAICINQQDLEEKSHQVQIMGTIFVQAERTYLCLGAHTTDTLRIDETMRHVGNLVPVIDPLLDFPTPYWMEGQPLRFSEPSQPDPAGLEVTDAANVLSRIISMHHGRATSVATNTYVAWSRPGIEICCSDC